MAQPPQDPLLIRRWAGRRRAAGITAVVGITFFEVITSELDHTIFITDDVTATVLGALVLGPLPGVEEGRSTTAWAT